MIAINNIMAGNTIGGFKRFGENSAIANNLFYNNEGNDLIEINNSVEPYDNIFTEDPLLDEVTLRPGINSPCIDAGLDKFILDEISVIEISPEEYSGSAPDIGAMESNGDITSASENYVPDNDPIRIYPNPTEGKFYIKNPSSDKFSYQIYSINGKLVESRNNITGSTTEVDLSHLAKGMYFIGVRTAEKMETHKVILK
jgi:hypothetical protein